MSQTSISPPRAVIFDAYGTLFDVHSVVAAAEQFFRIASCNQTDRTTNGRGCDRTSAELGVVSQHR